MGCIDGCKHGCDIVDNLQIGHIGFVCEDDLTIASDPDGRSIAWVDHLAAVYHEAEIQMESTKKMFYALLRSGKTAYRINLTDMTNESEVFELSEDIHPAYLDLTRAYRHPGSSRHS
jgi:hypothetical protein